MAGRFATSSKLPRLEPSSDGRFILACTRGVIENERWHRNAKCDIGHRVGRRASNAKCLTVFMLMTESRLDTTVKCKISRHRLGRVTVIPRPCHGLRLFLNRRYPRREPGRRFIDQIDRPYIILQKIQCTFKIDVPGMGHLGGGSDKDVCSHRPPRYHHA